MAEHRVGDVRPTQLLHTYGVGAMVELRPLAEETAQVEPYLQVFYLFQVMTAARRGETMGMTWDRVDFEAKTAFLPETKNGRARKLALRQDLVELLQDLPRGTATVFAVGVDYLVGSWAKACAMAGISDLHIHDARHEALSRLAESGRFTLPELQVFSGHRDPSTSTSATAASPLMRRFACSRRWRNSTSSARSKTAFASSPMLPWPTSSSRATAPARRCWPECAPTRETFRPNFGRRCHAARQHGYRCPRCVERACSYSSSAMCSSTGQ